MNEECLTEVMGPLFFLLFINDTIETRYEYAFQLFVDDTFKMKIIIFILSVGNNRIFTCPDDWENLLSSHFAGCLLPTSLTPELE